MKTQLIGIFYFHHWTYFYCIYFDSVRHDPNGLTLRVDCAVNFNSNT